MQNIDNLLTDDVAVPAAPSRKKQKKITIDKNSQFNDDQLLNDFKPIQGLCTGYEQYYYILTLHRRG